MKFRVVKCTQEAIKLIYANMNFEGKQAFYLNMQGVEILFLLLIISAPLDVRNISYTE